jgi:hypothetical protein
MTTPYQVHTEARGPHWIAWITRPGQTKPDQSVVLVAASEAEAAARARQWAERQGLSGALSGAPGRDTKPM